LTFLDLFLLRLKKLRIIMMQPLLRRALIRHHVMAGVEHRPVLDRKLSTLVDIGANRGQFALAARAYSGARVFSFEPFPGAASIFKEVFGADPEVKLHTAAVGESAGKTLLHVSALDDSSSLLPIGDAQSEVFPGTHEVGTLEVEVNTLDGFIKSEDIIRPAMLKLDVQGYELQCLKGCRSLIDKFDFIYCECSFVELYRNQKMAGDVIAYLQSLRFNLAGIYNPLYDVKGNCIQADILFKRINETT